MDADEVEIGYVPKPEDIDLEGTDLDIETLAGLVTIDKDLWREEAAGVHEFYGKFGDKLPDKLKEELATLDEKLK